MPFSVSAICVNMMCVFPLLSFCKILACVCHITYDAE